LYLQYLLALDMMGEDGALEHNPEVAGGHTAAGDPECLACVVVP
jgi:hypothetical protein